MPTPEIATGPAAGMPLVVDMATWQAARDELMVREKAHMREGDAIPAAPDGRGRRHGEGGGRRWGGAVHRTLPGSRRAVGPQAHVVRRRPDRGSVHGLHR